MRWVRHAAVVLALLFVTLGLPAFFTVDFSTLLSQEPDAVTSASLELPDQPSGEFLVLLNGSCHPDTLSQWRLFFAGEDAGVIMSDISCKVIAGDAAALQLARRYQARLPEHQMELKQENGLLLVSQAEAEKFDLLVLSKEAAQGYGLAELPPEVETVTVKGEAP